MQNFDVVVVGGGPAGGHCARLLTKANYKTLLVEQHENFERNNFSSAATPIKTLQRFDLPDEVVGSFWQKVVIVTSKINYNWDSPKQLGAVLNFAKLREFLAQEVRTYGGDVWLGYRYIKYIREGDRTLVFLQKKGEKANAVTTKVLVDATGYSRAVIYADKKKKPAFLKGTGSEYLIEVEAKEHERFSNCLTFLMGSRWMPKGYSWVFPMEDKLLKVGAAYISSEHLTAKNNKPLKKYIQILLTDYLQTNNYKIIDVHGSVLEYSSGLNDIYYRDNIIAIGDAVSTVNFLGGEGIRHGMYGAEIAYKYIDQYLRDRLANFKPYQQEMKRYFSWKWNLSEKISRKVYLAYNDAQFDRKITALNALSTEDLIDILFDYKFAKAYQVFGNYLQKKILSFLLRCLEIVRAKDKD